jgi:DnaJ-class molecular chaperone
VVTADIHMKSAQDPDDVYFVMFNILHDPLRLVVATVGDFVGMLSESQNLTVQQSQSVLVNDPEKFMQMVLGDQTRVFASAEEKVKVVLKSQKNADMARAVIASMINNGMYHQVSNYHVNGEVIVKTQEVPTKELMADLHQMLEIVKQWEDFDLREFLIKQGADPSQLDEILSAEGSQ